MDINPIQEKMQKGQYRYSDHATKRMIKRLIHKNEIEEAVLTGEIIEEYPEDKYSPSCLSYGKTFEGRELHVLVSLPPLIVVITSYEPDPLEWINGKLRR